MATECQVRVDPVLEHREPPSLERGRGTSPESERLSQMPRGGHGIPCRKSLAAFARELFKALEVELPDLDPQRVARRPRQEAVGAERLPQLRDVAL